MGETIREIWDTMSKNCEALYRVGTETGVNVRKCYNDMTGQLNIAGELISRRLDFVYIDRLVLSKGNHL